MRKEAPSSCAWQARCVDGGLCRVGPRPGIPPGGELRAEPCPAWPGSAARDPLREGISWREHKVLILEQPAGENGIPASLGALGPSPKQHS